MLTDTLVVATRNRAEDLRGLLVHLEGVVPLPCRILVVDASEGPDTEEACRTHTMEQVASRLVYVRAERVGLASQRNQALSMIENDIVHFLDDDSRPEPDYFSAVMAFFSRDTRRRVGAVTGVVVNPGRARRATMFHRFFLLSPRPGQLNRAGVNAVLRHETQPRQVDCLSGCSMSFRRSALVGLTFDEQLQQGVTGGYALGEDLDIGLQVRQRSEVWCVPSARLRHEESPHNRAQALVYSHAAAAFRRRLAEDPTSGVSALAFAWGCLGEAILAALNGVTQRDSHGVARARAILRGARDRSVCKPHA